jgi:hypothetical protein
MVGHSTVDTEDDPVIVRIRLQFEPRYLEFRRD